MKNVIEIKEEIQVGDIILEKGDKIKILKEDHAINIELFVQTQFRGDYKRALNSFLGYIGKTQGEMQTEEIVSDWYNRSHDHKQYYW